MQVIIEHGHAAHAQADHNYEQHDYRAEGRGQSGADFQIRKHALDLRNVLKVHQPHNCSGGCAHADAQQHRIMKLGRA
jgi:hypothetical protein